GVPRRVEAPVDRQGQLHHAEVRPQVPAGARDVGDQEGPDLLRQLPHLAPGEAVQVLRGADRFEKAHGQAVLSAGGWRVEQLPPEYRAVAVSLGGPGHDAGGPGPPWGEP